jgi:hypothetical protein
MVKCTIINLHSTLYFLPGNPFFPGEPENPGTPGAPGGPIIRIPGSVADLPFGPK